MLNHSTQTILKYTLGAQLGTTHLKNGPHSIDVALENPSQDLFIAIYEEEGHQVCGGADVTTAAAVPNEDGFTLVADVKTDSATVFWMAL